MSKRLELCWPNKDKVLLGLDAHGEPIWGTKDDIESRLLVQLEAVGQVNPDYPNDLYAQGDNLLIKGDNLLALKTLERHFAGKIKCIYIDPPFNTGNAFEHYDDGLEHTIWLSLMKPRLELLKKLLRPDDGMLFVHIDHREMAHLKVLLDEVIGRQNLLAIITVKVKDPAGVGQQSLVFDVCEYILCYARDASSPWLKSMPRPFEYRAEVGTAKGYTKAIVDFGKPKLVRELERQNIGEIRIFQCVGYKVEKLGKTTGYNDYISHFDRLFADYNPSGGTILQIRDQFPASGLCYMEYVPTKGRDAGKLTRVYFLNRRILAWLKDIAEVDQDGQIVRKTKMTNLWEVANAQLFAEGGVDFTQSKKPEALMEKILGAFTSEGDWVLDSFLGSGTTAAVAHKLKRRWIGVEIGPHADSLCLPRLRRVVTGKDQTGVSKELKWKGGGGFRYCVLGESLFAKDDDTGLVMINPEYKNGPLVAAVCAMEDFALNDDSVLQGRRGNLFAHVTEEKLTQAYVDELLGRVPETCGLNIYCMKRDRQLEFPKDRVRVRRIPKDLRVPPYLRGNGNGGVQSQLRFVPPSQEEDPAMKRKPKDPRPLIRLLRNARLKGPKDWAANIDRYIYGPTAGEPEPEPTGKGGPK